MEMNYNSEERIGVHSVAKIFVEKLKWIFREQPINDFGIDAFVEITKSALNFIDKIPTGKLIGIQIKSGNSFFKECGDDHFVYRGSIKHLEYWTGHSIPVIIILYDKINNLAYWQEVKTSTVLFTSKAFKIKIPKKNLLNERNREFLASISYFKNVYGYKLFQMRNNTSEVKLLMRADQFLYVAIDEVFGTDYCHITLLFSDREDDRYERIIHCHDEEGENDRWYHFYLNKGQSLQEAINDVIPWGAVFLDHLPYTDDLLRTYVMQRITDYFTGYTPSNSRDMHQLDTISLACSHFDMFCFRLRIQANELAGHFLAINAFLEKEPVVNQRVFIG